MTVGGRGGATGLTGPHRSRTPQRVQAAVIVLGGGSGTRLGTERNKVYLPLAGRSVVAWSLNTLAAVPGVGPLVLVIRAADREEAEWVLDREIDAGAVEIVTGGATRQESELAGLRQLADRIGSGAVDTVLIHDGARPLVRGTLAGALLHAARRHGGAVPGLRRDDLAHVGGDGTALGPAAPGLVAVQTPQAFRADPLLQAYEQAARVGFTGTDTAQCMERFAPDVDVVWIAGDPRNIKVTFGHDLVVAERLLAATGYRRP
jgi:2-C-methyl-D-erythritol 4-phosphate cytidylyltransferase